MLLSHMLPARVSEGGAGERMVLVNMANEAPLNPLRKFVDDQRILLHLVQNLKTHMMNCSTQRSPCNLKLCTCELGNLQYKLGVSYVTFAQISKLHQAICLENSTLISGICMDAEAVAVCNHRHINAGKCLTISPFGLPSGFYTLVAWPSLDGGYRIRPSSNAQPH